MRASLVLLFLASIASADANIVFNTISLSPPIPSNEGFSGGPQVQGSSFGQDAAVGVQFSLPFDDTITQIYFAIATDGSGPPDQDATLEVFSDNGGVPGSEIGTDAWNVTGATTLGEVQTVAVNFSVTANTIYWLVALPTDTTSATLWDMSTAGIGVDDNWTRESPIGGGWVTPVETTAPPAFALEDAIPEPASGVLVLSAFTIAIIARRISSR